MTTHLEQDRLYNQSLDYLLGRGVKKDEQRSFLLNAEAAHAGHGDALLAMGWFLLNGVGVERDADRAKKWYRESARRGEPRAMFSLGQIAYNERDFSDALRWFHRASDAGHCRSLYWLGKLFWRGQGVEQDKRRAKEFFHGAAGKKVREAQRFLRLLA